VCVCISLMVWWLPFKLPWTARIKCAIWIRATAMLPSDDQSNHISHLIKLRTPHSTLSDFFLYFSFWRVEHEMRKDSVLVDWLSVSLSLSSHLLRNKRSTYQISMKWTLVENTHTFMTVILKSKKKGRNGNGDEDVLKDLFLYSKLIVVQC
jgi:hypothetical protein